MRPKHRFDREEKLNTVVLPSKKPPVATAADTGALLRHNHQQAISGHRPTTLSDIVHIKCGSKRAHTLHNPNRYCNRFVLPLVGPHSTAALRRPSICSSVSPMVRMYPGTPP